MSNEFNHHYQSSSFMVRFKIPSVPFSKKFSYLQAPLGGLAFVLWLMAFQVASWATTHDHPITADIFSGYIMGFGTAFAGWLFIHLWNGNASEFIEPDGVLRWFSMISVAIALIFGAVGLINDLFGETSNWYNTCFFIGSGLMGMCTGPTIDSASEIGSKI